MNKLKKILFIIVYVILLFLLQQSNVFGATDITLWDNMASTYGDSIDFDNLPSEILDTDNYIFYYTTRWNSSSSSVEHKIYFTVFHNCFDYFTCTYESSFGSQDGIMRFGGFTGVSVYRYNVSTKSYNLETSNNNSSFTVNHCTMITQNYGSVLDSSLPSCFLANFDILDLNDNTNVLYHKNINNYWLYFSDHYSFHLGGNSNNTLTLISNYNYNVDKEPILSVYIGDKCISENFYNTVYLNSFKLNSGNFSIPYNRIFKENVPVNSVVWFILDIPDENGNVSKSFFCSKLTGSISIENYVPTTPDDSGGGDSGGGDNTNEIIENQQQTTNAIKEQTEAINDNNNFIKDESISDDNFVLPDDSSNDISKQGIENIFDLLYNSFTSGEAQDIVLPIPFTAKNIVIPSDYLENIFNNSNFNFLLMFIHAFYYFIVSSFIVRDIQKKFDKIKSGNIENLQNDNIKADML